MDAPLHGLTPPSEWIQRYAALIRPHGNVLDVACGGGRHMKLLASMGLHCTGIDRSGEALGHAGAHGEVIEADIEAKPWPLPGRRFDAVVVTHYLWRPLFPHLIDSLLDGGVLLYETFAIGHETVGKPSRPEFLLREGELLELAHQHRLRVVAFEDVWLDHPRRRIQRIAATR
jgi:SAM-dependent methyltransferase